MTLCVHRRMVTTNGSVARGDCRFIDFHFWQLLEKEKESVTCFTLDFCCCVYSVSPFHRFSSVPDHIYCDLLLSFRLVIA